MFSPYKNVSVVINLKATQYSLIYDGIEYWQEPLRPLLIDIGLVDLCEFAAPKVVQVQILVSPVTKNRRAIFAEFGPDKKMCSSMTMTTIYCLVGTSHLDHVKITGLLA